MPKFQKRPVVIEALQFDGTWDGAKVIVSWIRTETDDVNAAWAEHQTGHIYEVFIRTLEGDMRAVSGDWIIRGVQGEFYPCKPDIFAETCEAVES